ncbi:MAG: hypothetical protein FWE29_00855 [Defluviitaleaceae bacterium]|nr:hypothetical protein [Defluviitaleaceae bacterium]
MIKGIILKDDTRYDYTEDYLITCGHTFQKGNFPADNLGFIIFPFKQSVDESIYDDGFFSSLKEGTPIFSGIRSQYLTKKCEEYKLLYHVMMDDSCVAVRNAVPTSEGVILYLIANRINTVAGSKVLVIGYGICGRDLCKRLKALDANVYALVRSREKECNTYADGVKPIYISDFDKLSFDIIVNTVPEQILTNEMLDKANGAILIDIASAPFGFDMNYAKKLNEKSALLPGIPGKYAVKTAGEILGEYINHILSRRKQ